MEKWDKRFLFLSNQIAQFSKDKHTQLGAVIVNQDNVVVSQGWNGFPRGVNDHNEERYERPLKYMWTEHAERNAIYNAARIGVSVYGCRLYCRWFPCVDCARAIIQCGISSIITSPSENVTYWENSWKVAKEMLLEAGLSIYEYPKSNGEYLGITNFEYGIIDE